jgi:hypothetical protein
MAKPNWWEADAHMLATLEGCSLAEATDLVIFRWLQEGDLKALAGALKAGHVPAPWILAHIGKMLDPDDGGPELVPYQLLAKKRSGKSGPPTKPETVPRDLIATVMVRRLMKDGATQAEAIMGVADALGLGEELVKKALSKRYGHEGKQSAD